MMEHVIQGMNEVITNNYNASHKAIDIVASDGSESEIISLNDGVVTMAVNNVKGTNHASKGLSTYGNYVKVKQDDGKTALYAHMKYDSVKVSNGQYIQKGDVIGTMGATGNAYGKHLHLEIKDENNVNENPLDILAKKDNGFEVNDSDEVKNIESTDNNKTIEKTPFQTNSEQENFNEKVELKNKTIEHTVISNDEYLNASDYRYGSIVDGLKSIGFDSSFSYRKKLAKTNGIDNYLGTYNQNIKMLNLLKEGKLKKAI